MKGLETWFEKTFWINQTLIHVKQIHFIWVK